MQAHSNAFSHHRSTIKPSPTATHIGVIQRLGQLQVCGVEYKAIMAVLTEYLLLNSSAFNQLNLPQAQLNNIESLGYKQMTEVQQLALPLALAGKDLIAQARTGSGKTAAFGLAILNNINPRFFAVQSLIMCPTRELSTQVATELRKLARYQQNIKVVVLCGGQPLGPQIASLEYGCHIVVGTPGRIKDHLSKDTLKLDKVTSVVFDEADRMLDMGFYEDMETIIAPTPKDRQTLLFSATYPKNIETLSAKFQNAPEKIIVESSEPHTQIEQRFYSSDSRDRENTLLHALRHNNIENAVIFCNTKEETQTLNQCLNQAGYRSLAINGDMEQKLRDQTLIRFKHRSCHFLVATDVAARGLDVEDLPAVINYGMPRNTDTYVHRIGRTGRAGKTGLAISLVAQNEAHRHQRIVEFFDQDIPALENLAPFTSSYEIAAPESTTLAIAGGRKQKLRPGDILGALTAGAGLSKDQVGKIDVLDFQTYVSVNPEVAKKALQGLGAGKIKGRVFKVRIT